MMYLFGEYDDIDTVKGMLQQNLCGELTAE
jgi:hypothetical protein